jgi:hypothetical protein
LIQLKSSSKVFSQLRQLFSGQRSGGFRCSLVLLLFFSACGYRIVGSARTLPGGIKSLAIPTFKNQTRQFKIEQQFTAAVLKEFTLRTKVPVNSSERGAEAVLQGEIRYLNASPVSFGSDAFATAFLVTVQIAVRLVRVRDGSIIWENPDFIYRGQYVLNSKVTEFFSEENAAVDRMAQGFAASLASTILTR